MTSPKRAFSLVIVIVLGVAAFVVATTLLSVSESAGTRVAHSVQGDHAAAIAEAGMERTRAYLQGVTTGQVDFDLVLDPDLTANCGVTPPTPGSQALRPKFSDGASVPYRGKDWTLVPYDGGAYLVRFEDDSDDFRTQTSWDDYTSNNPGGTTCLEGPVLAGADNPLRDRNQTISVTVIGIAPGIDPERAVHRSTLRRMETFPGLAQVAGIQVRGNVNVAGSARLQACSPIASMQIDGNLSGDGSGTGCGCGESRADSVSTEWSHCSASTVCSAIGCQAGTLATPGPSVPPVPALDSGAGPDFYFDWAAPDVPPAPAPPVREGSCIFRIPANDQLWWWDPMASRGPGGVRCSTLEGSATSLPDIDPNDLSGFGRCWTPIIFGGVGLVTAEFAGGVWRPNGTAASISTGFGGFPAGVALRKPDWKDCRVIGHPAGSPLFCATCDGSNRAMDGSPLWFSGDSAAELTAIPAGTYIFDIPVSPQPMTAPVGTGPGQLNTSTFIPSQWPLMTVATTGSININSRIILGLSGSGAASFPAIIANNDIDIVANNENLIGGSVWSRGNWKWRGGSDNFFFGELHLEGNWEMEGNSSFIWNYQNQLSGAQIFPTPTAPTQSRSLD